MKTVHRLVPMLAVFLLISFALVSVGPAASATTQRALLKQRVTGYSNAFLDGRGADAYKMLTGRCKRRISRPQFVAASDLAKQIYGGPMRFTSYRSVIDGRRARVTYTFETRSLNQRREPWKRVNGRWRMNEC